MLLVPLSGADALVVYKAEVLADDGN